MDLRRSYSGTFHAVSLLLLLSLLFTCEKLAGRVGSRGVAVSWPQALCLFFLLLTPFASCLVPCVGVERRHLRLCLPGWGPPLSSLLMLRGTRCGDAPHGAQLTEWGLEGGVLRTVFLPSASLPQFSFRFLDAVDLTVFRSLQFCSF